jgi:DNA-binding transcriptional MerR regulator
MLKIGEFSRLTRVSVRMLRYYDEIGLLKPQRVDDESGYRYYSAAQLPRLNRILALQDLGFSLEQVGRLLQDDLSPEQLKGMLRLKQAELQERVLAEQERLGRVAARLQQIEAEDAPPRYDIILKSVPPQWVASARGMIGEYGAVSGLFGRLFAHVPPQTVGITAAIWHDDLRADEQIDAEALIYLREPLALVGDLAVYQLPQATMASVVHHGAFVSLGRAYDALIRWLDAQGYSVAGANREIYLQYTLPARADDESYVTELQFPVQRQAQSTPDEET